jgi:hypothetical protein
MNPMTLQELIYEMVNDRRAYATRNGFAVTEDEIFLSVMASLKANVKKMMREETAK